MKKYVITLLLSVAAFFSFSQNASYTNLDVRTRTRMMGSVFMTGISNTGTARALYINPATGEVTWSAPGGEIPLTISTVNYSSTIGSEAIAFTILNGNDTLDLGSAVGRTNDMIYVARTDLLGDSVVITGTPTFYYNSTGYPTFYLYGAMSGAILQSDGISWYVIGVWENSTGTVFENWTRDTTNGELYPAHLTDQVGIGTADPTEALHVVGNIMMQNPTDRPFIEFDRGMTVKGNIGALGAFEMNMSYNMDYRGGVHTYYDSTKNALWTALASDGYFLQYAPHGLADDIWDTWGNEYLWRVDTTGTTYNLGGGHFRGNVGVNMAKNEARTYDLTLGGAAAKTIAVNRHSTLNTAGNNLTVSAGGATTGATNKNGGTLILNSGISTGTGTGAIEFYTSPAAGTGTADNTPTKKAEITGLGTLNLYENLNLPVTTALVGQIKQNDITIFHTYGTGNNFLGISSGNFTTTGTQNMAYGGGTLTALTDGNYNVAIGNYALTTNTTGDNHVAIGYSALKDITGNKNNCIAIGYAAAENIVANANIAIGGIALRGGEASSSAFNTAIGYGALQSVTTGGSNHAMGYEALKSNQGGAQNIAIGQEAGWSNVSGSGNIFLGHNSGYNTTLSNRLIIDNANRGSAAADTTDSFIYGNIPLKKLTVNGIFNLPTTSATVGQIQMNNGRILHKYGTYNFFAGDSAGNFTTTGSGLNVGIGRKALIGLTNGNVNTIVGALAGINITSGSSNIAMGYQAIGGVPAVTGDWNIAIGKQNLWGLTSGDYNVAVGGGALGDITTTSNNTALGNNAGHDATGTGNVFIGNEAGSQQVAGDSKLFIDNSNTTSPLIGGDFATNQIKINGNLSLGVGVIADGDTSPDVSGSNTFVHAGTNPVTLADLDLPVIGAVYHIIGNSDVNTVTIADAAPFYLAAAAVLGVDDVLNLICLADNYYVELSRSNN